MEIRRLLRHDSLWLLRCLMDAWKATSFISFISFISLKAIYLFKSYT